MAPLRLTLAPLLLALLTGPFARPASAKHPSVGVVFFGLTRSLQYTYPTIQKHIFEPLQNASINYHVFLHTYTLSTGLTNPRTGEHNVSIDPTEFAVLNPTHAMIENQDIVDVDILRNLSAYTTHGDAWNDEYVSLKNLLRQYHSLGEAADMVGRQVARAGAPYDVLIYVRPDVYFFNSLKVTWLLEAAQNPNKVFLPDFHARRGVNDRFAIGAYGPMIRYGTRGRRAMEYSQTQQLHAETFCKHDIESGGFEVQKIPLYFGRVRGNGMLWEIPMQPLLLQPMRKAAERHPPHVSIENVANARKRMGIMFFFPGLILGILVGHFLGRAASKVSHVGARARALLKPFLGPDRAGKFDLEV